MGGKQEKGRQKRRDVYFSIHLSFSILLSSYHPHRIPFVQRASRPERDTKLQSARRTGEKKEQETEEIRGDERDYKSAGIK